jgi:hypothetical protein
VKHRRLVGWITASLLAFGFGLFAGCGSPVYYSDTTDGYYGASRWDDPWYHRSCCTEYDRPHRPPDARPPGHRPPGNRPPHVRPPGGGRPPGIPSRPRPHPRPHRR